jgi:hypothetical protein
VNFRLQPREIVTHGLTDNATPNFFRLGVLYRASKRHRLTGSAKLPTVTVQNGYQRLSKIAEHSASPR